jgi:malate permease and related proteins
VLGYLAGPRLELQARTLSRLSFTILAPAFTFDVMYTASIQAGIALRMTAYIIVVHIVCALVAFVVAKPILRRSPDMVAAYVLIAIFGNVGNFGLPIVVFALGEAALSAATIYYLAIMVVAFVVGVAAANWNQGSRFGAVLAVLKTPALVVLVPALLLNWWQLELPPVIDRPVGLLSDALIPTMLLMLGVQLSEVGMPRFSLDMALAGLLRLVVSPLLAIILALPFGLGGLERGSGILQSGMPAAVLTAIIASENDLLPGFVTATILFTTLASIITLTLLVGLVSL